MISYFGFGIGIVPLRSLDVVPYCLLCLSTPFLDWLTSCVLAGNQSDGDGQRSAALERSVLSGANRLHFRLADLRRLSPSRPKSDEGRRRRLGHRREAGRQPLRTCQGNRCPPTRPAAIAGWWRRADIYGGMGDGGRVASLGRFLKFESAGFVPQPHRNDEI